MQPVGFLEATLFISHLREHEAPEAETMSILLGIRLNEMNHESIAFLDLKFSWVSRIITHHQQLIPITDRNRTTNFHTQEARRERQRLKTFGVAVIVRFSSLNN